MKVVFSIFLSLIGFISVAQQEWEVDSLPIFDDLMQKKMKFVDYFNLIPQAVRDYTPKDFFITYNGMEINSIEIYMVDRYDKPIFDRKDINEANFVENKRGKFNASLVRKQLLFKEGQTVDPQLFVDTERNIRENTIFIDAIIKITPTPNVNGVDVEIYVHDNRHWKAIFWGSPTSITMGGKFYDFFGVNQTLEFYGAGLLDPRNPYKAGAEYEVNNMFKSQINMDLFFFKQNQSNSYGFEFSRKFFAYNTKWAGKLKFENTYKKIEDNSVNNNYNNKYFKTDAWLARSFPMPKINQRHQTMRFVISSRATITKNYKIPDPSVAPPQNFVNKQVYLGSFGIANRDWYGFKELYRFRKFDYVPKGINFAYLTGYEVNQNLGGRFYNGATVNYSKQYPKFGFMQNEFSCGSYIRNKSIEQMTIQTVNSYFTNRIKLGKLGFRQFITTNATLSFNRPYQEFYNIGTTALKGFDSQKLIGTKSFVLNLESVFYTPIHWWTSRGNFFFFADLAWIGNSNTDFIFNNTVQQGYCGGIRFQNLTLTIGYMEVSFAYYPNGYILNEKNWGYQVGDVPPRKVGTNNLLTEDILTDIY